MTTFKDAKELFLQETENSKMKVRFINPEVFTVGEGSYSFFFLLHDDIVMNDEKEVEKLILQAITEDINFFIVFEKEESVTSLLLHKLNDLETTNNPNYRMMIPMVIVNNTLVTCTLQYNASNGVKIHANAS